NWADEAERAELRKLAQDLPQVTISSRQLADLELLANGAYSPLRGFMTRSDYLHVVDEMHLSSGLPWSIPITLAVTSEQAATIHVGQKVALIDTDGVLQAVLTVEEKYLYDKHHE